MDITKNKKPFVSVIIVTYNYGSFIEEAIDSVLNQTFPQDEIEIIIVDDGSTDDTEVRIKKYKDKIHYIYKENGGMASAFNKGFEKAHGEIIAFLDADDYWDTHKLESIVNGFEQSGSIDFVYHDLHIIDNDRNIKTTYFKRRYPYLKNEFNHKPQKIEHDRYLRGQTILPFPPTTGISIKARCLQNIMPMPEHYKVCADTYLHYFSLFYAKEGFYIKEPLGYYRFHGGNITEDGSLLSGNKMTKNKLQQIIHVFTLLLQDIEKYGRNTGHDTNQLRVEFGWWITTWETELNKTFYFKAKVYFRTHYRILKNEGLKRYLLYSYHYRKGQVFNWIKKSLSLV